MSANAILTAMKAERVPRGVRGLWSVLKTRFDDKLSDLSVLHNNGSRVPAGLYTYLTRWTESHPPDGIGELVMNDFPQELKKHLDFVLRASGRVLVTGLGLGCVVRGLLAAGRVESVDLVERDPAVIELCAASVADRRVTIHHADAREWLPPGRFDFAWHDLWSDPDRGEPHLQLTHMELMTRLHGKVKAQGAWAMPRQFVRRVPEFRMRATT